MFQIGHSVHGSLRKKGDRTLGRSPGRGLRGCRWNGADAPDGYALAIVSATIVRAPFELPSLAAGRMPVRCNAPRNGLDCSGIPRCAAGAGACQWR
ncbi:hypothetical protein L665_04773 [Ralstonia solanacearum SD54]|nr:hypothetical protein L665_04773 [Ralstonia solanacearum SD54]